MVRISTEYDKELNQKVYMVRGDEAYARTTDAILTLSTFSNSDDSIDGYRVGYTINVLRDVGASSVTLYDGEDVLAVYDYDDSIEGITVGDSTSGGLILTYGIDHDLYVRYDGNSQCLASKSKVQRVNYPLPAKFNTEIAMTNTNASINEGANYTSTVSVTINGSGSLARLHNLDILIYVDDVYNQTITTGANTNTASLTINNQYLTKGLHTIKAEVVETSNIHQAVQSTQVSVGHQITFTEYPQNIYQNITATFKAKVIDYFNNNATGTAYLYTGSTQLSSGTLSNGVVTLTYSNPNQSSFKVKYGNSYSNSISLNYIQTDGFDIGTTDLLISKGNTLWVDVGLVDENSNPVPNLNINAVCTQGSTTIFNKTINTGSTGVGSVDYTGIGRGKNINLTLTYNYFSDTLTIADYLQYASVSKNMDFTDVEHTVADNSTITTTSQGYRLANATNLLIPSTTVGSIDYSANCVLEFNAKSNMEISPLIVKGTTIVIAPQKLKFNTNDSVKFIFVRNGNSVSMIVSKNNTNVYSYNYTHTGSQSWNIGVKFHSTNNYFDSFKVWRN